MKRKVLSSLLILALCMGLAMPAMAAEVQQKNPQTLAIGIPEAPELVFTLGSVYDEYLTGTVKESDNDDSLNTKPCYIFYFARGGTIACNQDVDISYASSKLNKGIVSSGAGTVSLKTGEKMTLNPGGWEYPDGEYIFGASIDIRDDASENIIATIRFLTSTDDSYDGYTVKGISGLVVSAPAIAESPSSWAVEPVNAAIAAGIVPETLQSKYTTATTRAEFCALAVALYEKVKGEITERKSFTDTTDINVEKCAAIGVVNGTNAEGTIFSPNTQLTREQAATMLSRLANAMDKPLAIQFPTFADNDSVSSWAVEAVGQMQVTGIMGGVGENTFAPKNDYTREQSIMTVVRLYDMVK